METKTNLPVISPEYLTSRNWMYFHQQRRTEGQIIKFLNDGTVGIHNNANERAWKFENDTLAFVNANGHVSVRFSKIELEQDCLLLSGNHIFDTRVVVCLSELKEWPKRPGTKHFLAEKIEKYGWEIGDHTYGLPSFIEEHLAHVKIGKYTSIAGGLSVCPETS